MNIIKFFINFGVMLLLCFQMEAQEANMPERTAEQEAARQTERLHQEVNLTADQEKKVYEINLKYARERMVNSSRRESLERSKTKEQELNQVLTHDQSNRLDEKRVERSVYQSVINSRNITTTNDVPENNAPTNTRTERPSQNTGNVRTDFRQAETTGTRSNAPNVESDRNQRSASPSSQRTYTAPQRNTSSSNNSRGNESTTSRSAAPNTRPTTPQYENNRATPRTRQQPSSSRSTSTPNAGNTRTNTNRAQPNTENNQRNSSTRR